MKDHLEPPFLLDSARVLMYAETGGGGSYTGRITVYSGDAHRLLGPVPRLAICEELTKGQVLLMRCDASWKVLAASFSASVDEAREIAEREYARVSSKWIRYRDLTAAELDEIEEERRSLSKLAVEFPLDGNDPHAV